MSDREKRALHLVTEYSRLTADIKACKPRIGQALEKCRGLKGHRLDEEAVDFDGAPVMLPTSEATNDQGTHLSAWFKGDVDDDGRYSAYEATEAECEHCFKAYEIVQYRKRLRRSLGAIKGAMFKFGRQS